MRTVLALLLVFTSFHSLAQTRGQALEEIRQWSDTVKNETYQTTASQDQLMQARELLIEAQGLLTGSRSSNDIICTRVTFGYAPVNSATGFQYGDNVTTLEECRRMLPPRGARALCTKARFGYQPMTTDRGQLIGDNEFSRLEECLEYAPRAGDQVMCARARFGYQPVLISTLQMLGEHVSRGEECKAMLPSRGSSLMCVKASFGYQAINIRSGRAIGDRSSTLEQCQRTIGL